MRKISTLILALALAAGLGAAVIVLESSDQHLLLEYRLEEYSISTQGGHSQIQASGLAYPGLQGTPLLPFEEIKVGLPPGGDLSYAVLSSDSRSLRLEKRLRPVPRVYDREGSSAYDYAVDEELYRAASLPLIEALGTAEFRSHPFAALQINPFTYDGQYGLRVTDRALIRISIEGNTSYRALPEEDEVAELFLGHLVNPQPSRYWLNQQRTIINHAEFSRSDYWVRLETDKEGMYKITHSQLGMLPLDDVDPTSFRLFSTGGSLQPFQIVTEGPLFREIPIIVAGEDDLSFDANDYIAFYGYNRDGISKNQNLSTIPTFFNPYTKNSVYWLTFGGDFDTPPQRMETLPVYTDFVSQTSTHLDQARLENEVYRRSQIGFDWFMTRLFGNSTASYEFTLELNDVDLTKQHLLSFMLQQEDVAADFWHHINVYVNGQPVESDTTRYSWKGVGAYTFQKNASGFVNGTNTVRIEVFRTNTDNLYLNYVAVDYTRLLNKGAGQYTAYQPVLSYNQNLRYNFTGSSATEIYRVNSWHDVVRVPLQNDAAGFHFIAPGIAGTRYVLSSNSELYSPLNITAATPTDLTLDPAQTDNIIITPDEYHTQAQSLADLHWQYYQKRSLVVKQSDIFDQFNGGHPDPAAIRQFVRYVYHNYPTPRLSSVILFGLGTLDWRNFSGQAAAKNKVITYQRNTLSSDDYFAMITNSFYPEVPIGRYPVRNTTEVDNMLSNFQRYSGSPQGGWWRNSMVMLGDDTFNGSQDVYENIHTQQTETAGNVVHPSVLVDKIFAWDYEYDEFQNKPGARDDMVAAINEGRLVWYYIGHGAYDNLGSEDYFNGATDMGRFDNPDRLPLFMAASCKVSQYDYWGFESLGQKVVLLDNLGAIASYSATRLSNPYQNAPMMENLLDSLANRRNRLGYAIMDAKIMYSGSTDNDAVYILMGDPLLKVIPPVRDSVMAVTGFQDGTLNARQQVGVSGSFGPSVLTGTAETRAFNTVTSKQFDSETIGTHRGSPIFKGGVTVTGGHYEGGFIVPDDVTTGNSGLIVSYAWDEALKQDYTNFYHPLPLDDSAVAVPNPDSPLIDIFLGSLDFRPGDTVGTNPTLYARISDSNGINITGSAGHNILLVLDNSLQPLPVTEYFTYDTDSHTSGLLTYPLSGLDEGSHTVQIIAFDNFNLPAVTSTNFIVKKSGELSIERLLLYPNPMQHETWVTFMLSQAGEVEISLFSVTGRKVHSFKATGLQGFNKVRWDGRDAKGDRLANNTYFVKVTARSDGRKAEKTERLVVYN
jgi:hypothetical protein